MRAIRIFEPGDYEVGDTMTLSESPAHHVGTVLRMQPGEGLVLFKGDGHEFKGHIESVKKKNVCVTLTSVSTRTCESPLTLHLGQAISKGQRMDIVVQKAVELGVTSITPLIAQHGAVKLTEDLLQKKQLHWQNIAIAAAEQCGRTYVPTVHPPLPLLRYVATPPTLLTLVLDPHDGISCKKQPPTSAPMRLLIGPEGGFSATEIQALRTLNVRGLSLGPRILRTETAAIAALTLLQVLYGDL